MARRRFLISMRSCCAAILPVLVFGSCSGTPTGAIPSSPQTVIQQGSKAQSQLELKVIDALGDQYLTGARYEVDTNRVVVTIWPRGDDLSEQQLDHYRVLAEQVTDGIPVVIEVDNGEPVRPG